MTDRCDGFAGVEEFRDEALQGGIFQIRAHAPRTMTAGQQQRIMGDGIDSIPALRRFIVMPRRDVIEVLTKCRV